MNEHETITYKLIPKKSVILYILFNSLQDFLQEYFIRHKFTVI